MRRSRLMATAAAVAVTGAMMLTFSPSQGSDAQWREKLETPVDGPKSDTFAMTAAGSDTPVPTWPGSNGIANSSQITLKNGSARHSSWVNVRSTRLNKVVPDGNNILTKAKLDYRFGAGSCTTDYWSARGAGSITEGTSYDRPQNKVTGATLAPGTSGLLCPTVGLDYSGANAQRDALLNHAGRALDITTVVNQRSEKPATWASQDQTVTNRYRLAMPTPTASSGGACVPGAIFSPQGGFAWAWPDQATGSTVDTPAMAGGWEILRKNASGAWESWDTLQANRRSATGYDPERISDDGRPKQEPREFVLRGYPFANTKSSYVESDWIVTARNTRPIFLDRWTCVDTTKNDHSGPHNMP